jgi:hypothetical protein
MTTGRPTLPLVIVEWLDAWTNELGVTVEDVGASHKPMRVQTIGWLLKDDEVGVSLASEHFDDGSYRDRTFIFRPMVVRVILFAPTPRHTRTATRRTRRGRTTR